MKEYNTLHLHRVINKLILLCIIGAVAVFTSVEIFSQTQNTPPYGISLEEWELFQTPQNENGSGITPQAEDGTVFINGGFETGDFSSWVTQDLASPHILLQVNGAGFDPGFGFFLSDPPEGSFAAIHGFDGGGPGTIRVAQDVTLHSAAQFLELDYRAAWDLLTFGATLDRTFSVSVEPSGGGTPLQTDIILTAVAGTINFDTGNLHGSVNVSSFANQSVRISFDWDIPENFTGPGFFQLDDVFVSPPIPVELTSFSAILNNSDVELTWNTATETNNLGFEINRKIMNEEESEWITIGFREGNGTTTEPQVYTYNDNIEGIIAESFIYRLKQIDYDGSFEFSEEITVENILAQPKEFSLFQNYPNPFNPSTIISFDLPSSGYTSLIIYNALGKEVALLIDRELKSGSYEIEWNANEIPSGIYFYQLNTEKFVETKKMILMK